MSNMDQNSSESWQVNLPELSWTAVASGVAFVCMGTILLGLRKRSKAKAAAKEAKLRPAEQKPKHDTGVPLAPGKGAPLFTGIRVVDLSTHVAAPTASRVLADLGAEVIHVEVPDGDLFRYTLLDFEAGREFCSLFDVSNAGKYSVQLDLKTAEGISHLHKLLEGADVLITNMRTEPLRRLNLDYDSIKNEHPQVVYAQISAWGLEGPLSVAPGYDIGAFYASTGMASVVQPNERKQAYPPGFGDLTTGQMLLSGVAMGLKQRLSTGCGLYVNSTLLRTGMWCMSGQILKAVGDEGAAKDGEVPDYESAYFTDCNCFRKPYKSSDDVTFYLVSTQSDEEVAKKLDAAFQLDSTKGDGEDAWNQEKLESVFGSMSFDAIAFNLSQVMLEYSRLRSAPEVCELRSNEDFPGIQNVLHKPKFDVQDLSFLPLPPYSFSCSKDHVPRFRAPAKGAHTDVFVSEGWTEVHPAARLGPSGPSAKGDPHLPLAGVLVVELSSGEIQTVAATTSLLRDHGATVVKVEDGSSWGDKLRKSHPKLFSNLNRGKRSVALNLKSGGDGISKLMDLVIQADVLVTDMTATTRRALSVDDEVLHQLNPTLVIASFNAFPASHPKTFDNVRFESPIHAESGVASALCPRGAYSPPFLLELVAAPYLFAAVSCAVFHRERTGEGQVVRSDAFHVGVWLNQIASTWCDRQADFLQAFTIGDTDREVRLSTPTPVFNAYKTKDGMEVMLLGLETKRHLGKVAKALGIRMSMYPKIIWKVLTDVIPKRKEKNLIKKLKSVIQVMCTEIDTAIGAMDYVDLTKLFEEHDIWYCPVRTPEQLLTMEQADAIGAFVYEKENEESKFIASPLEISDKVEHATLNQHKYIPPPPAFNEAEGANVGELRG